jgi:hypothetical protein
MADLFSLHETLMCFKFNRKITTDALAYAKQKNYYFELWKTAHQIF